MKLNNIIKEYKIIQARIYEVEYFERIVSEYLNNGYELCGQLFITEHREKESGITYKLFNQPVVREIG